MPHNALKRLHKGIDIEKKIVTATHDFQDKLFDAETVVRHMKERFGDGLGEFYERLLHELEMLREIIQFTPVNGRLTVVLKDKDVKVMFRNESNYDKRGQWVSKKIIEDVEAEHALVMIVREHFQNMKRLYEEGNDLFGRKGEEIIGPKELGREKKNFEKFMKGVLKFILAYEKVFEKAERELKKLA
ncbi:TPA: hypothetical protein HA265_07550 [Candidatus Woesearchaeota archaeon]|nr:hypothetical protein [Candidatus Woesearchaeota archaeon]